MKRGIDVSSYQGVIDWGKVKGDGVQFAILKVIRKDLTPDKQFEANWKGCEAVVIPIHGVYNYSYATTVAKAVSDAKKVLLILNGRKARVYLDVEDACQKNLGKLLIDIINAYAEVIRGAGLEFGVYTGLSFYNTYIRPYGGVSCPLWIARYGNNDGSLKEAYKPSVAGMVGWQYTSKAKVAGISGNVDMNVWYEELEQKEVDSMGKTADKVIEQARSWIGKKESDGSHKEIVDIYNSHLPLARGYKVTYTDSWCATFVSAVAIKLGYTDIIPTECSCQRMIDSFKAIGRWIENENRTPKAGDVIFYDWQDTGSGDNAGWSDHVGIVESVSGGQITVIEGNYDDAVKRRKLAVNGRYIRGYGVPAYDAVTSAPAPQKSVEEIAKEVIAGKWGSGDSRKKKLASAGYDYATIQAKVNELLAVYYPKYTGSSKQIDVVFKAIGVPDKFRGNAMKRKPIATANGISNYSGTATQNLSLIALAKEGKLKRV
jgi:GH25 family lysozyme M1 (1,4-beta-N-acetylmuramidase)